MKKIKFTDLHKTLDIQEAGDIMVFTKHASNMRCIGHIYYMIKSISEDGKREMVKLLKKDGYFAVSSAKTVWFAKNTDLTSLWRMEK